MFPPSWFFSANRRFVRARANNFQEYSKHSFRNFDKLVEIWHLVYFNTGLIQNLVHINVFLELWAHLFKENLGTRRLAIKGGESSSHFRWFTIAKIELQFLIFFVLILGLRLQRYSTNTKRCPPKKSFWKLWVLIFPPKHSSLNY